MSRRARLLLDVVLAIALLFAYNPAVTGMPAHEWLSLALVVPAFVHIVVNWDWSVRAVRNFVTRLRAASRLDLVVDALLFVSTVAVTVSGLAVSRTLAGLFGTVGTVDAAWHVAHSLSATATIALFIVHAALHASWIASAARSLFADGARSATPALVEEPRTAVPSRPDERRPW